MVDVSWCCWCWDSDLLAGVCVCSFVCGVVLVVDLRLLMFGWLFVIWFVIFGLYVTCFIVCLV